MPLSEKERLELLLKIRWAEDPCRRMELTQSQRQVVESKARYIAVRGGNRTGKTAVSAYKLARIARRLPDCKTTNVQGVYIVFAPARQQLQDPWGKKLLKASEVKGELFEKPFIPAYEIANVWYTYGAGDKTPALIELKNGNYILFCVSGDKNVWKRIEGKGYVLGVVLDESAGTDELLTELAVRLLDANSNEQVKREAGGAWILWGATQTKKSPAFERFLALGKSGADPDYAAFDLVTGENPAIDQTEREKLAAIMSKESYEIRMLGHGSAAGAMALYPQWDDDRNLVPVGQEYVPGIDDNLWWFLDPGVQYTGMVIAAINRLYPQRLNIVAVWQPQRCTLKACVTIVRDWLGGRKLEGIVYDQAARKGNQAGRSILGELITMINQKGTDIYAHRSALMGRSEYKATVPLVRRYIRCENGDEGYPTNLILNRESGCGLLQWQLKNCAFTDKAYELKEENIAKGNDHCFIAGTMVLTPSGERPIESLRPGNVIRNRFGDFPVLLTLHTPSRPVLRVEAGERSLIGTGNHLVETTDGPTRIDCLHTGSMLLSWKRSNTADSPTAEIRKVPTQAHGTSSAAAQKTASESTCFCIGPSGKTHMVQSPQDITSIIGMEIGATTTWPIWNVLPTQNIWGIMSESGWPTRNTEMPIYGFSNTRAFAMRNGESLQRESPLCVSEPQRCSPNGSREKSSVNTADLRSYPEACIHYSALQSAGLSGVETLNWTTRNESAKHVEMPSSDHVIAGLSVAPERVLGVYDDRRTEDVYTITVLGPSEYVANGFVVRNCSDALRYGISRKPGWVDRGANPKIWGPGTNGVDPDLSRTDHGDTTAADHTIAAPPFIVTDTESPAARQRRKEAANREKRLKQSRSVW